MGEIQVYRAYKLLETFPRIVHRNEIYFKVSL